MRGHLHKGNSCPAFRQIEEGKRAHPVFAFSQLPLAQNNPYARVAYFGVAFSVPLQGQGFERQ